MLQKTKISAGAAIAVLAVALLAGCGSSGGNGKIDFGTSIKKSGTSYSIQGSKSTFHSTDAWAYVANLSDTANTHLLSFTLLRNGNVVLHANTHVNNTKANEIAEQSRAVIFKKWGPGKYTLRYYRGSKKLAEGSFTYSG